MEKEAAAANLSVTDAVRPPPFFLMENLPEKIQPLVMSLLPLKEAARTSIVSRNWRTLWTCHSNLCFDGSDDSLNWGMLCPCHPCHSNPCFDGTRDQCTNLDSVKIKREEFIKTVNCIIQQHRGIGLNKFSIKCALYEKDFDHLDRWICFATASRAKIIDINLNKSGPPSKQAAYHFPLEALDAEDVSFVQSLFLTDVSIRPHPGMCGFTKLTSLALQFVDISGDLAGFLKKCPILEDLEIFACSALGNLSIPHQLGKLQRLLVGRTDVQMVEFHAADLASFEYSGPKIPIVLHGCSRLEKATLRYNTANDTLGHAFTEVPSILPVKILRVATYMEKNEQVVDKVTVRPQRMFMHLKQLTCQITIFCDDPNSHNGILQLARYLDFAPQLETLHLDMYYFDQLLGYCWSGEVTGPHSHMRRHDHLKTVDMSGFRCFRAQVELACCILEKAPMLEHVTIQPEILISCNPIVNFEIPLDKIRKWAWRTSRRFRKVITIL